VQFIDLAAQQKRIRAQLEKNLLAVLDHGKYIMGPEVGTLEKQLADFVSVKNAVACASGTDALLMALMANNVGPGDAVFTTPFTFIATAEVIQLLGATPVFVDIDPVSFNIDPDNLSKAIRALADRDPSGHPLPVGFERIKPKAVIAVDLFGLPADYARIVPLAAEAGLVVIEDAAQSFGARYNGESACSLGAIGCTSFFPAKPLGGYGDGGMCFTNDDGLAETLRSIRIHGKGTDKYDNVRVGINGRLDTLQAAILLAKFSIFQEEIGLRHKVAERYNELISGISSLVPPRVPSHSTSVWAQYSVLAKNGDHRDRFQRDLQKTGIPTAVYYPKPLHMQTAMAHLEYHTGDFPVSEEVATRIFSLPMHPYLAADDQKKIVEALCESERACLEIEN
jgi:UDP-2-acetamido-2-deoxy-ribo-hexuluronate aminotransferase